MTTSCGVEQSSTKLEPTSRFGNKVSYEKQNQLLVQFIESKLTNDEGSIYTNYLDTEQNELAATGHEVLSESMGLAMRYYARSGQQTQFHVAWTTLQQQMNMESGFSYRYSPKHQRSYTVNAAVDDLRIIRALYEAAEQFKQSEYEEQADTLGARFMANNISGEHLYDFYDDEYGVRNNFITLCYVDLRTLKMIDEADEHGKLLRNMTQLLHNGYLTDQFPFYETRYLYDEGMYQSEDINTIESLLTILNLVEVREHKASSIDYIKQKVEQGELYGRYSRDGKPLTDIQSTAIYAITAMIGSELGDQELYEASMNRMEQFQVKYVDNELYGAYGNSDSLQAFSFDNLQALLAYSY